jgi:hypothetical protein
MGFDCTPNGAGAPPPFQEAKGRQGGQGGQAGDARRNLVAIRAVLGVRSALAQVTRGDRPLMLPAMVRVSRLALALLSSLLPAGAALASGLPCQPCAGIRLDAGATAALAAATAPADTPPSGPPGQPASATPAASFDLLRFLRAAHLPPASPFFVAWEVTLPALPALPATAGQTGGGAPAPSTVAPALPPALAPGSSAAAAAIPPPAAATANPILAAAAAANPIPTAADRMAAAVGAAGATPWVSLVFTTPSPLAGNLAHFQEELNAAAGIAAAAPRNTWFQVVWRPAPAAAAAFGAAEYAFLLKRAAVTLTGAQAGLHVATEPLPPDPAVLTAFYAAEVAAYLDLVTLAPRSDGDDEGGAAAVQKIHDLDPGRPIALDFLPYPAAPPGAALAEAARRATAGFDLTLFQAAAVTAAEVSPLIVLAREFAGDLSYDAASSPTGAAESWAFVRGKDLALRVIAAGPAGGAPADLVLHFADPELRRPTLFPLGPLPAAGPPGANPVAAPVGRVTPPPQPALEVKIAAAPPVIVLGLDRPTAAERHGVAEKVEVASRHEITVEEILKRLQAFEDAQSRRVDEYTAIDTTHLRFQPNAGADSIEATLAGPLFWSRESGGDWAWESLFVNGIRWRGKTLPEIPLIQPEKAAALPLEILFTRDYRYRLRGSAKLDGRDAWVVDFSPAATGVAGRRLYRGTVWVDHATGARLRTRGVQVGLEGEVISNEETLYYTPIDALGRPAPWAPESFVMPLRLVAEQVLSILDAPTLVERETLLTNVQINPPDFAARRQTVESSDVTMVRDTDKGLQYLVKKGDGPRVVKAGYAQSQLFAIGGLFVDDSLSYPLPLAGLNYFNFDFKNTGEQVNVFFAGLLLVASAADPRLNGSRFNLGADAFAIALPFTDNLYHEGHEVVDEEVRIRPATFDLKLGRPLGDFVNVGISYGLLASVYTKNSNTSPQFVLPSDNILQSFAGSVSFSRYGYTLASNYSYNIRSSWSAWGLPGNPDYSPADRDFTRYDFTLSKNWYLPFFQKIAAEIDYYGGSHLDRFSKYEFGFFGGTRIHGYRSDDVRAESTYLTHLSYGFDFGHTFRLDALVDAALATDRIDGLDNAFLAGTGLAGSLMGPWQTLVTLDAGIPVAGPDHGFVLYLVFLKLFR